MHKTIFHINSSNRLSGTHSNFSYALKNLKNSSDAQPYTHVVVLQCSIPKSYYLVQSNLNSFILNENGTEYTIEMNVGNYSRTGFMITLQTALNNAGAWTYVVTADDSNTGAETGKLNFSVSGNGGIQPSFIFTTKLYEALGFERNSIVSFSSDTLRSTNVINLQKESTLFIHSDICASDAGDNILQSVFASNTTDYGNIVFTNECTILNSKKIITTKLSESYNFYLTDENNIPIDLNGRNWQMVLCLFQMDNTYNLLKAYIKTKLIK